MKRWSFLHCTFFLPLCMRACSLSHFSHTQLFVTPQTVVHQAPLSVEFSRQEYWSGLSCPRPGELPNPRIEPTSLMSPALASKFLNTGATWKGGLLNHEGGMPISNADFWDPSN